MRTPRSNIPLRRILALACAAALAAAAAAQQRVEGFAEVVNSQRPGRNVPTLDFRGLARGHPTATWYIPGQMTGPNILSWRTARVPAKARTTFVFIGATSVLPMEFSRGPIARLSVNGRHALDFSIGYARDMSWSQGEYELVYRSMRIETPYTTSHRSFELNGNSGYFELTVPASAVEAGQPVELSVELQPFPGWKNGWFAVKHRTDALAESPAQVRGELDALRRDVASLREENQALAAQLYADHFGREGFRHQIVHTNGNRHLHPADVIRLKDGELLLMWREGTEHISNDGDVVMMRSKDGGKTWGERTIIAGIKNVDEREGCGLQLADGTIIVGIFYNNLYKPDGTYTTGAEKSGLLASRDGHYLGAYFIRSTDNGRTWSKPDYIETAEMPFQNLEGPTDAPIEMPDGSVVMALIGYSPQGDVGNRSAVFVRSTDKGRTWKYVSTIAADPGGTRGGFLEPGIVRTKTGRIVAAMRNHGGENAIWVAHSDDDGRTWSEVKETAMIGHPVDLIELPDGRLLATYGLRPGRHVNPGGIRACFSGDNGVTWDIATEVQLRNDFLNWDIGYPESILMPNGEVLTFYYYNLFNKYFIGATRWKP